MTTGALTSQTITDSKGNIHWFGLTISLLIGISLIYTIRESSLSMKQMKVTDAENAKKIAELELNLKNALGNKYKSVS